MSAEGSKAPDMKDGNSKQGRIKQIAYGKNTKGYQRYIMLIPKDKRGPNDPQTPDADEKMSKRRFEGKLRQWRLELHKFDPQTQEEEKELNDYLEQLQTVSYDICGLQDDIEMADMRLWDLLDDSLHDELSNIFIIQKNICFVNKQIQPTGHTIQFLLQTNSFLIELKPSCE